jgi:hypothetical protein
MVVSYRKRYEARLIIFILEKTNELGQKSWRRSRLLPTSERVWRYRLKFRISSFRVAALEWSVDYLLSCSR